MYITHLTAKKEVGLNMIGSRGAAFYLVYAHESAFQPAPIKEKHSSMQLSPPLLTNPLAFALFHEKS